MVVEPSRVCIGGKEVEVVALSTGDPSCHDLHPSSETPTSCISQQHNRIPRLLPVAACCINNPSLLLPNHGKANGRKASPCLCRPEQRGRDVYLDPEPDRIVLLHPESFTDKPQDGTGWEACQPGYTSSVSATIQPQSRPQGSERCRITRARSVSVHH